MRIIDAQGRLDTRKVTYNGIDFLPLLEVTKNAARTDMFE